MLTFETQYACPVRLIHGGGAGQLGLCAMELLAVMTGELHKETSLPTEWVPTVNEDIRNLVVKVNDTGLLWSTPEQRADLLWPILPKVFNTFQVQAAFPREAYAELLGIPQAITPVSVLNMYMLLGSLSQAQEVALDGLKKGISLFWESWELTPQDDYTPEQIARLEEWVTSQQENPYIKRQEYATA